MSGDRHPDILEAVARAGRETGHPETCPTQFAEWWADFVTEPSNARWMPYRDLFSRCWDASADALWKSFKRLEGLR